MKNNILKILLLSIIVSLSIRIFPITYEEPMNNNRRAILIEKVIYRNKINYKEEISKQIKVAIENMNGDLQEINNIENLKDWFVSYKGLIEDYSCVLDFPETIYDYYSDDELNLLFKVVQAEVGDEYSFEQKVNVASVIFNRIEHEDFPDNIYDVLSIDQFQTISDGGHKEVEVSETTILACEYSFMFGDTTGGYLFFDSNGKLNYEFVKNDGAHNLYK